MEPLTPESDRPAQRVTDEQLGDVILAAQASLSSVHLNWHGVLDLALDLADARATLRDHQGRTA